VVVLEVGVGVEEAVDDLGRGRSGPRWLADDRDTVVGPLELEVAAFPHRAGRRDAGAARERQHRAHRDRYAQPH
jgi:hypothetical protein